MVARVRVFCVPTADWSPLDAEGPRTSRKSPMYTQPLSRWLCFPTRARPSSQNFVDIETMEICVQIFFDLLTLKDANSLHGVVSLPPIRGAGGVELA